MTPEQQKRFDGIVAAIKCALDPDLSTEARQTAGSAAISNLKQLLYDVGAVISDLTENELDLLRQGKKLEAIKEYKMRTGCSLMQAKTKIERN